jgi:hypothetical protein
LFQVGFFNLVGHGIFHPRPENPPFQQPQNFPETLIPWPHVFMKTEPPANDGWREIVNHASSHRHGWTTLSFTLPPPPPQFNPNAQISHVASPVHSSYLSKRLKTDIPQPMIDNRKEVDSPSSPPTESYKFVSSCLHLKYDFSHLISAIQPQASNQPRDTPEKSRGDSSEKRKYASHSNKYGF